MLSGEIELKNTHYYYYIIISGVLAVNIYVYIFAYMMYA